MTLAMVRLPSLPPSLPPSCVRRDRTTILYVQLFLRLSSLPPSLPPSLGAYRLAVRFAQTVLLTAILSLGWKLTSSGGMTMDQLTSALFYVQFVMGASFDVSDQYSKIQEALGSATQVRPSSLPPSLPPFRLVVCVFVCAVRNGCKF